MKREDLPLVTPEQFGKFNPCWLLTEDGRARFRRVAAQRPEWSALDVLDLEDVSGYEKLWAALREEFLPPMLLHEFACRCAEWALSFADNPDPRSAEAIRVKRRWIAGEATDSELRFAWDAALAEMKRVQERLVTLGAAWDTAREAAWATARDAAQTVGHVAKLPAARAAEFAERHPRSALAMANERASALEHEVSMLRALIDEWE